MFEQFKKPIQQNQQRPIQQKTDGCKIKVRRDSQGRVTGYESNGRCSPQEQKAFIESLESNQFEEDEE